MRKLGWNVSELAFSDILSPEQWALEMVPKPVKAVLLLYPIKESLEAYEKSEAERIAKDGQVGGKEKKKNDEEREN